MCIRDRIRSDKTFKLLIEIKKSLLAKGNEAEALYIGTIVPMYLYSISENLHHLEHTDLSVGCIIFGHPQNNFMYYSCG